MILGVGSFAHSIGAALADTGARVSTYLTRNYGHFPPSLVGPVFSRSAFPSPVPLLKKIGVEVVIPQSIDWALQPWAEDLLQSGVGHFQPHAARRCGLNASAISPGKLCARLQNSLSAAYVASNR